jgi:hypothetical protein
MHYLNFIKFLRNQLHFEVINNLNRKEFSIAFTSFNLKVKQQENIIK